MERRRLSLAECFRIATRRLSDERVRMLRDQLRAVGGMPLSVRAVTDALLKRRRSRK